MSPQNYRQEMVTAMPTAMAGIGYVPVNTLYDIVIINILNPLEKKPFKLNFITIKLTNILQTTWPFARIDKNTFALY